MRISDSLYVKSISGNTVTIDGSTQSNLFVITDNGYIGIGTASPSDIFEIKSTTTKGITVRNASSTLSARLYTQTTDGGIMTLYNDSGIAGVSFVANWYSYVMNRFGVGTNNPTHLLDVKASTQDGLFITRTSDGISTSSLTTQNSLGGLLSLTNDVGLLKVLIVGDGNDSYINNGFGFGIGTSSTSSKLHVVGSGTTSGTYALKIENSSNTNLISARNDGLVIINDLTIGKGAGSGNATNTAFGVGVLTSNTIGVFNTGVGYQSLNSVTIGNRNTAVGKWSGLGITDGNSNTFIGDLCAQWTNSGSYNVAMGQQSFYQNRTGNYNTSIGESSLYNNYYGSGNIAIGSEALYANSSSNNNTAIGRGALRSSATSSSESVALGSQTLYYNISGGSNTGLGTRAGHWSSGSNNTFVGYESGYNNTGTGSICVGMVSGYYETGSNNLYIHNGLGVTDLASGKSNSLIYGIFNASTSNQRLTLNGNVGIQTAATSSSSLLVGGLVGVQPSLATSSIAIGGSFYEFVDSSQSIGSSASILNTTSGNKSTANYLNRVGDKFKGTFTGYFTGATSSTKSIQLKFGGTSIFYSNAMSLVNDNFWRLEFTLLNKNGASVVSEAIFSTNDSTTKTSYTQVYSDINIFTLSNDNVIEIIGQSSGTASVTGDVVSKFGYIEYNPGTL